MRVWSEAGVLENVVGLTQVKTEVMGHLTRCLPEFLALCLDGCEDQIRYEILWLKINPFLSLSRASVSGSGLRTSFGSPISRERIYIVMIRRELMAKKARVNFSDHAEKICDALKVEADVTWQLEA